MTIMLTQTKAGRGVLTLIWSVVGVTCPAVTGAQTDAAKSIPMRLELTLVSPNIVTGETLILRVRITNPNPFTVFLEGFEFGDIEPKIEMQTGDGGFRRAGGSTEHVLGGPPIELRGGGYIEIRRFLIDFLVVDRWPQDPGFYRLRLASSLNALNPDNLSEYWRVDWTSNEVELTVTEPSPLDHRAMEFLMRNLSFGPSAENDLRSPIERSLSRINTYREFVKSFGDSAYGHEIRWTLAKELTELLGGRYRRELSADQLADLQDAFAHSVTFCLDRGSIYADEFLEWDVDRGGNEVLEQALMRGQWELLERLEKELALRRPDDQAAILFRRTIILAFTGKEREARATLGKLRMDFPKSPYVQTAEGDLAEASRKSGGE